MICAHCGRDSDPLFKFCLHCGKELGGKKPAKKAEAAAKPEPVVERRAQPVEAEAPAKPAKAAGPVVPKKAEAPPAKVAKPTPKPSGEPGKAAPRCPRCRAKLPTNVTVCPLCGARLDGEEAEPAPERVDEGRQTQELGPKRKAVGFLISVSSVDGRETVKMPLKAGKNSLGRGSCDLRFPEDDLLSPTHMTVEVDGDSAMLVCPQTRNGTYLRMTEPVKLEHGDLFRVGQQLLRFEDLEKMEPVLAALDPGTTVLGSPAGPKAWGRLTQIVGENLDGSSFLLTSENVFLGRERGNITFPGDRYISGTHAVVTRKPDGTWLRDVGSSNGSYVRIKGQVSVVTGQFFLAGRQLFKLLLGQ